MGKRSRGKTKHNASPKVRQATKPPPPPQRCTSLLKKIASGDEDIVLPKVSRMDVNPDKIARKIRPAGGAKKGRKVDPTHWRHINRFGSSATSKRTWFVEDARQNRIFTAAKIALKEKRNGFVNEKELWHGTSEMNALGILEGHFRLPWHFGMFGKGIYFGSRNKASSYAHTGGVLLRCRVLLGRTLEAVESMRSLTPEEIEYMGYDSVHGKANITASWGGTLRNDEWVVYNPDHIKIMEIEEV